MRQTCCEECGLDIEGSYREGWVDRGGNTHCPMRGYDEDGYLVERKRERKHKPVKMFR